MPAKWKGDLLLSKCFDFALDNIDSSMWGGGGVLVTMKGYMCPQTRTFRRKR